MWPVIKLEGPGHTGNTPQTSQGGKCQEHVLPQIERKTCLENEACFRRIKDLLHCDIICVAQLSLS